MCIFLKTSPTIENNRNGAFPLLQKLAATSLDYAVWTKGLIHVSLRLERIQLSNSVCTHGRGALTLFQGITWAAFYRCLSRVSHNERNLKQQIILLECGYAGGLNCRPRDKQSTWFWLAEQDGASACTIGLAKSLARVHQSVEVTNKAIHMHEFYAELHYSTTLQILHKKKLKYIWTLHRYCLFGCSKVF